jgi:hypothetical protein
MVGQPGSLMPTSDRKVEGGRPERNGHEVRMVFAAAVLLCGGVSMTIKATPASSPGPKIGVHFSPRPLS